MGQLYDKIVWKAHQMAECKIFSQFSLHMKVSYGFVIIWKPKMGFENLHESLLLRDRFLKFKNFFMKNVPLGEEISGI